MIIACLADSLQAFRHVIVSMLKVLQTFDEVRLSSKLSTSYIQATWIVNFVSGDMNKNKLNFIGHPERNKKIN